MNHSSDPHTVETVRQDIAKELKGKKIPHRQTIARWLEESGQERISDRVEEHVSYWKNHIIQTSTLNPYPSYSFCKFSPTEFSDLSNVLCSVFNTNQVQLETFYNSWRNTFDVADYPQPQMVDRSFFVPEGKEFREQYNKAPMIGSDLPSLIELNNTCSNKPTIVILAQDPLRSQQSEKIELGTPFGFHAKGCREHYRATKLYFKMVDVLLRKGYRVYLTDIFKIWIRQAGEQNRGIKLGSNADRFLNLLEAELKICNPVALITWGKQSAKAIQNLPLKVNSFNFPHPSGGNRCWPTILNGQSATHANKVKYWQSRIEDWKLNGTNK